VWRRSTGCIAIVALGLFSVPLGADAQRAAMSHRIGWLGSSNAPSDPDAAIGDFQQALRDLGYVEGKNLVIEYRYASGNVQRLPALANEVASLPVEIIVTSGEPAALAAKRATKTIPIVVTELDLDPVKAGLLASLGRPGGNVTGLASLSEELWQKRLALLKEFAPNASRLVVLWNPANPGNASCLEDIKAAASAVGREVRSLEVSDAKALEQAFANLITTRPDGLITCWDTVTLVHAKAIADFALKLRLPMLAPLREYVHAGGLISYGPSLAAQRRRAAYYVDKILKGAKPADLPVELPDYFELVINLATVRALGLVLPPNFRLLADDFIQ
jgi:putative tryptophan/tyrosine transport system substrate-binding protein